jgi:predicted transcriptional regulator of viral defense system
MNKTLQTLNFFKHSPGIHTHKELLEAGAYPNLLRKLVKENALVEVSRGYYQLAGYSPEAFDLEEISAIIPNGVFCLISALSFHNIGTQVPREYYVAIPIGTNSTERKEYTIRNFFYSEKVYNAGIEKHGNIRVYGIAKTVADCFKFRNKIGLEVALEALKEVLHSRSATVQEIIAMADICRVRKVMMPYMEAYSS